MDIVRPLVDGEGRASPRVARLWLTFGPAALLLGVAAAAVILTGHEEGGGRIIAAVLGVAIAWAFVAAGLVAWGRVHASRIGPLMVATGFAWFLAALSFSDRSLVFTLGLLVFPAAYAVLVHLLLAYPSGKLSGRRDTAVVALAYLDVSVLRLPWLLFQPFPNENCLDCPENVLLVSDRPAFADAANALTTVIGVALLLYVVVRYAQRWRAASQRGRRALAPIAAAGVGFLLALVAVLLLEPFSNTAAGVANLFVFVFLLAVPLAFLLGLVRSRLATAGASRFLLDAPAAPEEAQESLRRALGDPTLELAYWLPERGAYVDIGGNPLALPPDGSGRMATPISFDESPVAALIHDESLRQEPELVEAVVAAARVTLERDRLAAELRARLDELQRERDFVATVVNNAPSLFCVVDLEGRIRRFNTTAEVLTGVRDGEAVRGQTFWDTFVVPEQADAVGERLLAAGARFEGTAETETEIRGADGERLILAWCATPIVDAQGNRRLLIAGTDVTERRQQAVALERERDFGHAVTDTTPSFLVVVDGDGRITPGGVNAAAEQALGQTEAELVGQRFVDAFVPPSGQVEATRALAAAGRGELAEREGVWRGRDGTELWVAWSCRPLSGAGEGRRFLVCGADLTERRRHEHELQRERDVLNTIANAAPSLLLIVDGSGRLTDEGLNVAARRVLGYSDEEVAGRDFLELLVVHEDLPRASTHFERAVASREAAEIDSTWVTRTGDPLRVAWSATWLARADDGERDLFLVCGTDVTERERHAEAIRRERDFINTVANATPSLMCVIDRNARIAHRGSNQAFEQALGYGGWEVGGLDFAETFVPSDQREDVRAKLERVIAGGAPFEQDNVWLAKDGRRLDVAWACIAPRDFEERGLFLVSGVDVTERARQEDELRASRARIVEAADAERRRLERNLHDGAQQRLVTLSLSLRLAEARLEAGEAQALLRAARDELAQALDELRDLARGIHPAVLSDHGLAAAIDALAQRVPLPVYVAGTPAERLPEPVEVAAYYVVSEALANVQKYARASQVEIGVEAENGHTVVEVRDDGVGGADASGGSGLRGLADRVEALGGRLEIESAAGAGTTVRAHIPVA